MPDPKPSPSSDDADLIQRRILMLTFKKNSTPGLTAEEENELAQLRRQRDNQQVLANGGSRYN